MQWDGGYGTQEDSTLNPTPQAFALLGLALRLWPAVVGALLVVLAVFALLTKSEPARVAAVRYCTNTECVVELVDGLRPRWTWARLSRCE